MTDTARYLQDMLVGNDPWNDGNIIGYRAADGSYVYHDDMPSLRRW